MIYILFEEALYIKGEDVKTIPLREIILRDDLDDVIEHLFCPNEECKARLVYNRKANGNNYLSKRIGVQHIEECPYERGVVPLRTVSFFQEENGRLSDNGISRRKTDAMKALDDLLDPPETEPKKTTKPRPRPRKPEDGDEGDAPTVVRVGRRIVYDPEAEIVNADPESEVKTYEPPFLQRHLHQISKKDKGKNIKTSAKLDEVIIDRKNERAQIKGSLKDVKVVFELTQVFFNSSRRSLVADELFNYLDDLKAYIDSSKNNLYLTTLCQSHEIDLLDLRLFIYEPDFMSFQFVRGKQFKTLRDLIVAINTNAI